MPLVRGVKCPNGEPYTVLLDPPWHIESVQSLFASHRSWHMLTWLMLRDEMGQTVADTERKD